MTLQTWKSLAYKQLGEDSLALHWKSADGRLREPYATPEALAGIPTGAVVAAQPTHTTPEVRGTIHLNATKNDSATINELLGLGYNAFAFSGDFSNLPKSLSPVKPTDTPLYFSVDEATVFPFLDAYARLFPYQWKGGLSFNPKDFSPEILTKLWQQTTQHPHFRLGEINVDIHKPLAEVLGEVISLITSTKLPPEQIFGRLRFVVVTPPEHLWLALARVRALRFLCLKIQEAYGIAQPVGVFTETRLSAPCNTNEGMIAFTTTSILARWATVNAIEIPIRDSPNAQRLMVNVQHILTHEGYFPVHGADPLGGSYLVEALTWELIETAWNTLKN